MNVETLHDLFVVELHRAYGIERRLAERLEKLERDADIDALDDLQSTGAREMLTDVFEGHRAETRQQVRRLEDALAALDRPTDARSTPALDGLLDQNEQFNNVVLSDDLRPVYHLDVGRQIERLEITTYERLLRIADHLDVPDDVRDALEENLAEERATLRALESISDDAAFATLLEEQAADAE